MKYLNGATFRNDKELHTDRKKQESVEEKSEESKVWFCYYVFSCLAELQFPFFSGIGSALFGNPIRRYAKQHDIFMEEYPEELLSLYERNKETETFVEEYPLKKDLEPEIDLSSLASETKVPLLLQWDTRWGYHTYAGEVMGLSGCGPTCLSMVTIFMTGDTSKNPRWMADFAAQNGYAVDGSGNAWALDAGRCTATGIFQ